MSLADSCLEGKFWWVSIVEDERSRRHAVIGTAELITLLDQGRTVGVGTGPHDTRDEAEYSLDLFWEMPGDV